MKGAPTSARPVPAHNKGMSAVSPCMLLLGEEHVLPTTAHHALGCSKTRTEQNAYELYSCAHEPCRRKWHFGIAIAVQLGSEQNACDMYSCTHGPCRQLVEQSSCSLDCNCAVELTHGLEWRERSTCSLKWLHSLRPGSQQPPFPASFSESGAPPAFMAKQICQGSLPAVLRTTSFC